MKAWWCTALTNWEETLWSYYRKIGKYWPLCTFSWRTDAILKASRCFLRLSQVAYVSVFVGGKNKLSSFRSPILSRSMNCPKWKQTFRATLSRSTTSITWWASLMASASWPSTLTSLKCYQSAGRSLLPKSMSIFSWAKPSSLLTNKELSLSSSTTLKTPKILSKWRWPQSPGSQSEQRSPLLLFTLLGLPFLALLRARWAGWE